MNLPQRIDNFIKTGPAGAPWREVTSREEAYAKMFDGADGAGWALLGQVLADMIHQRLQVGGDPSAVRAPLSLLRRTLNVLPLEAGEKFELIVPADKRAGFIDAEIPALATETVRRVSAMRLDSWRAFEKPPTDAELIALVESVSNEQAHAEDNLMVRVARNSGPTTGVTSVANVFNYAKHLREQGEVTSIIFNRAQLGVVARVPGFHAQTDLRIIRQGQVGSWSLNPDPAAAREPHVLIHTAAVGLEEAVPPGAALIVRRTDRHHVGVRAKLFSEPYQQPGTPVRDLTHEELLLLAPGAEWPRVDGKPSCPVFTQTKIQLAPLAGRGWAFQETLELGLLEGEVNYVEIV